MDINSYVKPSLHCSFADGHYVHATFDGLTEGVHINHNVYYLKLSTPLRASVEHHATSDDIYIDVKQTYGVIKRKTGKIYLFLISSAQLVVLIIQVTYIKKKKNIPFKQLQYLLL